MDTYNDDINPFKISQHQLDQAAAIMGLDEATHELLRWPMREIHLTMPVKMDDGTTRIFHGYRVQYNDARGPNKGGIRFHPQETIDTIRALAAWMTWKTAVVNIPLGGSQGGIICDPKTLSTTELERLSRAYIRALGVHNIGIEKDIPAPDVYTNPQVMAWMADEYITLRGESKFGVITGKPPALGGSAGRDDAPARGAMYIVREAARALDLSLDGYTAAIQGYGSVGQSAHKLAAELLGLKIVAVSDSRGGIYNPGGLSYKAVSHYKRTSGALKDYPATEAITNEQLLELEVDVLFPAALENVITKRNATKIRARIVAELANGPTTPEADRILYNKGVYIIPDFLCNAGGVTVSYFEMVQNSYQFYWDERLVHQRLDEKITGAFKEVHKTAQAYNVHNRLAAYLVAVARVAEAMKLRGWV